MECVPTSRVETVRVARPLDKLTLPSAVLPSRKITLPLGVPEPGGTAATFAVKVTA